MRCQCQCHSYQPNRHARWVGVKTVVQTVVSLIYAVTYLLR